jgi:hypothetical protein
LVSLKVSIPFKTTNFPMLRLKCMIPWIAILSALTGFSQTRAIDTIPQVGIESLAVDTSLDYEDMMNDLGDFLDSLLAPRSYLLISASASRGYFNYKNKAGTKIETKAQMIFSPVIGYYHKSGPGLTISSNGTNTDKGFPLYQYIITPSFDFIKSSKWVGGISYSRYIDKDSLEFYLTPLQNELNAYFLYRKSWLQPGVSFAYGWGSSEDVKKNERYIKLLRLRRKVPIIVTTNTQESISDFSINASLRHTFYWLALSKHNDYIKFTPMLVLSTGTQKYGFNQTTSVASQNVIQIASIDGIRKNENLDNTTKFQPLSLTLYLRPEYNIGKFFIQPQLLLDYYFPGTDNKFTAVASLNAGFMF